MTSPYWTAIRFPHQLRAPALRRRRCWACQVDRVGEPGDLFHGLHWKASPSYFAPERSPFSDSYINTVDLVMSCVDLRSARKAMHEAFGSQSGPWCGVRYWLDLGNNASNGQFVLGQPLNTANKRHGERLRTVAELYPQIVDTSQGEDDLPSCSAAAALDRQEPFINQALAS